MNQYGGDSISKSSIIEIPAVQKNNETDRWYPWGD